MPKIKRFQNPLKSANGHVSSSTTPAAQALSRASINPAQTHEVPHEEQAAFLPQQEQPPIVPVTSIRPRESAQYWKVEAKDLENAIKQINVKVNEVNNLTVGERIIVEFDDYNAAYGEPQGLLAGYYGSLEQIELKMTQCDTNKSEISPDDIIGKMLGPEHSERVAHLESQLEGTLTTLKDYMISKEGGVPRGFSSLLAPQTQPIDAENEQISPVDGRGSLDDNNTNH
ncbi:hypothetical protein HAX54_000950 [Datura stramonium]|uniref:Uncharacterized protein n=1 Tax=Datura stramonium TaxID=4076 RepID=A0ABS8WQD5_DATST|nr:hypothetical protein [Datura stramonium]